MQEINRSRCVESQETGFHGWFVGFLGITSKCARRSNHLIFHLRLNNLSTYVRSFSQGASNEEMFFSF